MATFPTIHLNGTGRNDLRDEYAAAYDAIDKAIEALASATLNGRDYYPQAAGAYSQARSERDAALAQLRQAHQYVGEMLMGICDQLP
jgi:phage shock protein A